VTDCLFCKIAAGEIPSTMVHSDDRAVAIEDINPAAPVHVLVIPREHHATVPDLRDAGLLAHVFDVAHQVAQSRGVAEEGYRLVFNVGRRAQQSVWHVHLHVLGGRDFTWPPG